MGRYFDYDRDFGGSPSAPLIPPPPRSRRYLDYDQLFGPPTPPPPAGGFSEFWREQVQPVGRAIGDIYEEYAAPVLDPIMGALNVGGAATGRLASGLAPEAYERALAANIAGGEAEGLARLKQEPGVGQIAAEALLPGPREGWAGAAKTVGGLVGDIFTDPLTYGTGGVAALSKVGKAAQAAKGLGRVGAAARALPGAAYDVLRSPVAGLVYAPEIARGVAAGVDVAAENVTEHGLFSEEVAAPLAQSAVMGGLGALMGRGARNEIAAWKERSKVAGVKGQEAPPPPAGVPPEALVPYVPPPPDWTFAPQQGEVVPGRPNYIDPDQPVFPLPPALPEGGIDATQYDVDFPEGPDARPALIPAPEPGAPRLPRGAPELPGAGRPALPPVAPQLQAPIRVEAPEGVVDAEIITRAEAPQATAPEPVVAQAPPAPEAPKLRRVLTPEEMTPEQLSALRTFEERSLLYEGPERRQAEQPVEFERRAQEAEPVAGIPLQVETPFKDWPEAKYRRWLKNEHPQSLRNKLQARGDAAYERMRARGSEATTNLGADPAILADLVDYGAARIAVYGLDKAKWAGDMLREFGEGVRAQLDEIWEKARNFHGWITDQYKEGDPQDPARVGRPVRGMVARYMTAHPELPSFDVKTSKILRIDEARAKRIADAFDAMKHEPNDPRVRIAYEAMKSDVLDQYEFATREGYRLEPWAQEGQPYKNSAEMRKDVLDNKHLWYFKTEEGFGPKDVPDNPLLDRAPNGLLYNDMFRAIHDVFAHAKEGFEFGPRGEENAWHEHYQMFSPEARPAMTTETRGQNSWVNFGKHLRNAWGEIPKKGEEGYVAPPDRPYSEQKTGLLPAEFFISQIQPKGQRQTELIDYGASRVAAHGGDFAKWSADMVEHFGAGIQKRLDALWAESTSRSGLTQREDFDFLAEAGAPDSVVDKPSFNKLTTRLQKMAKEGEVGKDWYEDSSREILRLTQGNRDEAEKLAQLIAIYSPNNPVPANWNDAVQAYSQWKAGAQTIDAGNYTARDRAAEALLLRGEDWRGAKTNNFYRNLMTVIDPEGKGHPSNLGTTIDLHMMRALGYNRLAPSTRQYIWADNLFAKLGRDMGWLPHQVQAAAWTAQKNVRDASGKLVKQDFSDVAKENLAQVSFEVVPHATSGVLPELQAASLADRQRYTEGFKDALYNDEGVDEIAQSLGLLRHDVYGGPGFYAGVSNPGFQLEVAAPPKQAHPTTQSLEEVKAARASIDPGTQRLIEDYARVVAVLGNQESVAYHRPFFKQQTLQDSNGLEYRIGRVPTTAELKAVYDAMPTDLLRSGAALRDQVAYVPSGQGLRLLNFTGLPNRRFQLLAEKALAAGITDDGDLKYFASAGDLVYNPARVEGKVQGGQDPVAVLGLEGRPDVRGAVERAAARVQELNARWARELAPGAERAPAIERPSPPLPFGVSEAPPKGPAGGPREAPAARDEATGLEGAYQEALSRLKARGGDPTAFGGVPLQPQVLADLGVVGARWIAQGAKSLAEFTAKLVTEFGEGIRSLAQTIYNSALELFGRTQVAAPAPSTLGAAAPAGAAPPSGPRPIRPIPPPRATGAAPAAPSPRSEVPKAPVPEFTPEQAAAAREFVGAPRGEGKPLGKGRPEDFDINVERISADKIIEQLNVRLVESAPGYFGKVKGGARGEVSTWESVREKAVALGADEAELKRAFNKSGGFLRDVDLERAGIAQKELTGRAQTRWQEFERLTSEGKKAEAEDVRTLYDAEISKLAAINYILIGAKAQAARALQLGRKLSESMTVEEKFFQTLAKETGVTDALRKRLYDTLVRKDYQGARKAMREIYNPTFMQKVVEGWKAGLLSGVPTQVVNFASTATKTSLIDPLEALVAGALDSVRGVPPAQRQRFLGEGMAMLKGARAGMDFALFDEAEGLLPALRDIATGRFEGKQFEKGLRTGEEGAFEHAGKIGGRLGEAIRIPFQLLNAADNFWKTIAESQSLHRQGFRTGKQQGLTGAALEAHIKDFRERYVLGTLSNLDSVKSEIKNARLRGTFQEQMGPFGRGLVQMSNAHPAMDFVIPFKKTPINIAAATIARTPIGLANAYYKFKKGNLSEAEYRERQAQALVGTTLAAAIYWAAVSEGGLDFTGAGPTDPNELQNLKDTGWQPYSIKVGDTYISYQRLEPLSSIIGFAADAKEIRDAKSMAAKIEKAGASIADNLLNQEYLAGLTGLAQAVQDPKRHAKSWLKQLEGSLVPAIVGKAAKAIDPTIRVTDPFETVKGIPEPIAANIPFLSRELPARKTPVGEERERKPIQQLLSPFPVSQTKAGPIADVQREYARLSFIPGQPQTYMMLPGGKKLDLDDREYELLQGTYRDAARKVSALIKSHSYKNLPDNEQEGSGRTKEDAIQKIYRDARVRGRAKLYQDPEFRRRAAKRKAERGE